MDQVYKKKLWGGDSFEYYSGVGSHHPSLVIPYVQTVRSFLKSFNEPLVVCDLGCGDFNVGKELVSFTKKYWAIDIVPDLMEFNKNKFKAKNLEFLCLDIASHDWPSADVVLLRQVLQHLSNSEVECITDKLKNYCYVIVTEHLPEGNYIPNKDIISGQGIRLKKNSGINLSMPPFYMKPKEEIQLLSLESPDFRGIIVTSLYKMK
ncbi:class I SAM-dependent methyltransferase [Galbibacter sp. BG1]|nr:class I SAM-dependent methyltransferase [Galbibacter sp. BG1]